MVSQFGPISSVHQALYTKLDNRLLSPLLALVRNQITAAKRMERTLPRSTLIIRMNGQKPKLKFSHNEISVLFDLPQTNSK
jgi:hypothetical protein